MKTEIVKFLTLAAFLTEKSIDGEAFEAMSAEERNPLLKEHGEGQEAYLKSLKENADSTKEEIAKAVEAVRETQIRESKEVKEILSKQGVAITKMLDKMQGSATSLPESTRAQISKFIHDNKDEIARLKNAGTGEIKMTVKVVGPISDASATNPDGLPELLGVQAAAPMNVNLRGAIVDSLVNTFNTNQAVFAYTDTVPKDGDYSFLAECEIKPQMDFSIETRYAQPVKVAAHIVLCEEATDDIPNIEDIAQNYLRAKHALKRQNGILFGDGVAPNPKGATVYGRVFVAGGMANCVPDPTFMDIVNACITDIYTTHNYVDEMNYMANIAMVNPIDFYCELVAAKDGNGLPLYPMASLFNRVTIGGVTIVPEETIPAGKIFVADMSKYNVSRYVDYTVRIGWINDQFITNQFTMVGESRFHAFVKKLDEQAFIYDDIATIKTAITT